MLIHAPTQTKTDGKVGECPSVNKYKFWEIIITYLFILTLLTKE